MKKEKLTEQREPLSIVGQVVNNTAIHKLLWLLIDEAGTITHSASLSLETIAEKLRSILALQFS